MRSEAGVLVKSWWVSSGSSVTLADKAARARAVRGEVWVEVSVGYSDDEYCEMGPKARSAALGEAEDAALAGMMSLGMYDVSGDGDAASDADREG